MSGERPPITLFGKLPSRLDFVRVHHDTDEGLAFDAWLQAATQHLAERATSWPDEDLCFVFCSSEAKRGLLGAITPSRDRSGRKYPLAIFTSWQPSTPAAAVPLGAASFLAAARELLGQLKVGKPPALEDALAQLTVPSTDQLARSFQDHMFGYSQRSAGVWLDQLGEPGEVPDRQLAYRRLLAALRSSIGAEDARPTTWELRADDSYSVATWLSLFALVGSPHAVSAFWSTSGPGSRMLLTLGASPAQVPLWFASAGMRTKLARIDVGDIELPAFSDAASRAAREDCTVAQLLSLLRDDLTPA